MSRTPEDEDIEDLRERRLKELQEQAEGQQQGGEAQEAAQQQAEAQRKAILRQFLTDEARKRLNTVKMSKPDFGEQVERQVVALAQSGRLQGKIDDDQMRELLKELQPESKRFDIKRR